MSWFSKKEETTEEPNTVESTLVPITEEDKAAYRKKAAKAWADLVAPLTEEEGEQTRKKFWQK